MRSVESLRESIEKFGCAVLRKETTTSEEMLKIAEEGGFDWSVTAFHYVLKNKGDHGSQTDWERIRKERDEKKLKAAVAKKKKEGK